MTAGGNQFQKVQSGQRRVLPADVWNAMLDTVEFVQSLRESGGALVGAAAAPVCVKPIKNTTDGDLARFQVLGIDSVLYTPDDDPDEFAARPALKGVVPRLPDHLGRFAVLAEPVAKDDVGLAVFSGVVPVKVYITSGQEWYEYADIDATQEHLVLRPYGAAAVLWKETGTGEKWALVRLGNPAGQVVYWGGLSAQLNFGSYADASLSYKGQTYTQRVYDLLLGSGQNLSSGRRIVATYWPDEQKFYVTGAPC